MHIIIIAYFFSMAILFYIVSVFFMHLAKKEEKAYF